MSENNTNPNSSEGNHRELADEVARFESLITNVPAIIYRCALDKDWTMEYISEFTEELTGYPASDFLHHVRSFASIIHPEDRAHVERVVDDSLHSDGHTLLSIELLIVREIRSGYSKKAR